MVCVRSSSRTTRLTSLLHLLMFILAQPWTKSLYMVRRTSSSTCSSWGLKNTLERTSTRSLFPIMAAPQMHSQIWRTRTITSTSLMRPLVKLWIDSPSFLYVLFLVTLRRNERWRLSTLSTTCHSRMTFGANSILSRTSLTNSPYFDALYVATLSRCNKRASVKVY